MDLINMIFLLALGLSVILIFLNSFLAKKNFLGREKPSPFECGFDVKTSSRLSFSIRFFLIAVIFLVFDVEITLIIPLPFLIFNTNPLLISAISCWFIFILLSGLYHEWKEGALLWK